MSLSNNSNSYTNSGTTWSDPILTPIVTPIDHQDMGSARPAVSTLPRFASVTALPTTNVWGLPFAQATMSDAIELADQVVQAGKPEYFITANLNYLMLVDESPELAEVNEKCCCILADGNPIVWRSKLEPKQLPCRVAGSDMIIELGRLSAEKGYKIFFLGGAPGVADAAAETLKRFFPEMKIAGTYSPPFRQLSPEEHQQMLARIRQAGTDILLVAFGQPKGELWIYDNLEQLGVPLSIQLGASFDFLAGTAKRAPKFWQVIGCEWLYRAFSDPKRLLPRYGKNIYFLARLLFQDFLLGFKELVALSRSQVEKLRDRVRQKA